MQDPCLPVVVRGIDIKQTHTHHHSDKLCCMPGRKNTGGNRKKTLLDYEAGQVSLKNDLCTDG